MSLKNRREVDRLCLFKKGLDNNAILPLDELSKPTRKTRHMHNRHYTTIYALTNIFKFSFQYHAQLEIGIIHHIMS